MKKLFFIILVFFAASSPGFAQDGGSQAKASFYSSSFSGKKTATGHTYRHSLLTAASNAYKLGTRLLVVNKNNGKKVEVVVNDRMAKHLKGRVDLSQSAFQKIASLDKGVVPVKVYVLNGEDPENVL